MHRIVYSVACSLDGYIARENHSFDWIPQDQDYGLATFFKSVDDALIGRKTHDLMVSAGQLTFLGMANYVFSRNPNPPNYKGVHWVTTDPVSFVRGLRQKLGKDIWLMGSSNLARIFFESRMVSEIKLKVVPVLLVKGIPLFPEFNPEIALKLIEQKSHSSGVVQLCYECVERGV
jgi:dihydrofolate reductase